MMKMRKGDAIVSLFHVLCVLMVVSVSAVCIKGCYDADHERELKAEQLKMKFDSRVHSLELENKILREQVRQLASVAPTNFVVTVDLEKVIH